MRKLIGVMFLWGSATLAGPRLAGGSLAGFELHRCLGETCFSLSAPEAQVSSITDRGFVAFGKLKIDDRQFEIFDTGFSFRSDFVSGSLDQGREFILTERGLTIFPSPSRSLPAKATGR